MSSHVVTDPRRRFGAPCVRGTRIDPPLVAAHFFALGIEETWTSYPHLTRDDVLVSLWWVARYGRKRDVGGKAAERGQRWDRLRAWLDANEEAMWANEDWSGVPLP